MNSIDRALLAAGGDPAHAPLGEDAVPLRIAAEWGRSKRGRGIAGACVCEVYGETHWYAGAVQSPADLYYLGLRWAFREFLLRGRGIPRDRRPLVLQFATDPADVVHRLTDPHAGWPAALGGSLPGGSDIWWVLLGMMHAGGRLRVERGALGSSVAAHLAMVTRQARRLPAFPETPSEADITWAFGKAPHAEPPYVAPQVESRP